MSRLVDLPNELLYRIAAHLDQQAAAEFRLVCRAVTEAAKNRLFSNITLRPTENSTEAFLSILNSPDVSKLVRSCHIHTCDEESGDAVNADEKELPETWHTCFEQFVSLPNLRAASLNFSPMCCSPETDDWVYPETTEFRIAILSRFFALLNDENARKIHDISIINLQNLNDEHMASGGNFKDVLGRLQALKLCIVTEQDEPSPEYTLHKPEFQTFMNELPETWLMPILPHIRSLVLSQDEPYGYLPKLDLRSIHFAQMRSLHLGNWTFTHDWQVDWIISHHETLQELFLFDCAIVFHVMPNGPVDGEGYYATAYDAEDYLVEDAEFKFDRRWHNFFDRFRTELLHLRHFRIGVQPAGESLSGMELPVALSRTRYIGFRGGGMPTPWVHETAGLKEYEELDDAPECDDEDREALERLLGKIGQAKVPNQDLCIGLPGKNWNSSYRVENWMET